MAKADPGEEEAKADPGASVIDDDDDDEFEK